MQANLFHEFHPMGGVSARLAEGELFSCAKRLGTQSETTKIEMQTGRLRESRLFFMQTLYQKCLQIGTLAFV